MSLCLSLPFGRYKVQFPSRHLSLCLSGIHRRRAKRRECFDEQVTSRGSVFFTFRSKSSRRDSNMQRRCADGFVCTWCLYLMCVCVCVCVCVFCGQILGLTDMLTQFSLTAVRPILTHRLTQIHPQHNHPHIARHNYVSLCNGNFSSSPSPPLPHPQVLTPYTHPPTYIHTYLESTYPQVYIWFACMYIHRV